MVAIRVAGPIDFVAGVFAAVTSSAEAVLIPVEPEAAMRAERTKGGVPLPDDTSAAIVNAAREAGVSEVSTQRATR